MKRFLPFILIICLFFGSLNAAQRITTGEVTGTTVLAGICSLIVWPGIGQAINGQPEKKVFGHALFGLIDLATKIPLTRVWSCFDAVVDRNGGYLDGAL